MMHTNYKIDAHNFDFVTRSRLGDQINEGNEYWEGSVRGFWNLGTYDDDLAFSQFLVNESDQYHMPSDPIPGNNQWFRGNNNNDEQCDIEDVGPSGQLTFFGDPTRLCDYWDDVKALKDNDPKLFMTKVTHIIRYFDVRPWLTMPDCIKLYPIFIDLCGLHVVMDAVDRLSRLGDISPSRSSLVSDIESLLTLHDQYSILTSPMARESKAIEIRNSINLAKPEFQNESFADHAAIQVIKNDLSNIKCSDRIIVVMTDAWLSYIEELGNEDLDENPE